MTAGAVQRRVLVQMAVTTDPHDLNLRPCEQAVDDALELTVEAGRLIEKAHLVSSFHCLREGSHGTHTQTTAAMMSMVPNAIKKNASHPRSNELRIGITVDGLLDPHNSLVHAVNFRLRETPESS